MSFVFRVVLSVEDPEEKDLTAYSMVDIKTNTHETVAENPG